MENDTKEIIWKINCVGCLSKNKTFYTKRSGFDYYKCSDCKMISLYSVPKSYSDIYEAEYFKGGSGGFGYVNYDEDKEPMRESFKRYLSIVENLSNKKGKLFDVGAATGFFINLAKEYGFSVSGVEISDFAADIARKRGFDVKTGVLEFKEIDKESFDVITMLDVIEHMPDPEVSLQISNKILKSGGLLVINTPDSGSIYSKMMGKNWHLLIPPEHIHLFNKDGIKKLLQRNGFELVMSTHIGKKFTVEYILNMLFKWLKFKIFQNMAMGLKGTKVGRISLPLDLHDNMFILAKKIK